MRVLRFSDFTERLMLVGAFENKRFVVRCSDSEKNIKFLRIQQVSQYFASFPALRRIRRWNFILRVSPREKNLTLFCMFRISDNFTKLMSIFRVI